MYPLSVLVFPMHEMYPLSVLVFPLATDHSIVDSPLNCASNYRTRPLGLRSGVDVTLVSESDPRKFFWGSGSETNVTPVWQLTKGPVPGEIASHTLRREEAKGVACETWESVKPWELKGLQNCTESCIMRIMKWQLLLKNLCSVEVRGQQKQLTKNVLLHIACWVRYGLLITT